jgi:Ni,Fe-hydrogenase I small subunit
MTYKEYVSIIEPSAINDCFEGGVCGCPVDFKLEAYSDCYGCGDDHFHDCKECWNRELEDGFIR